MSGRYCYGNIFFKFHSIDSADGVVILIDYAIDNIFNKKMKLPAASCGVSKRNCAVAILTLKCYSEINPPSL